MTHLWIELETNTIYAMSFIGGRIKTFSFEYMSEMTTAFGTANLCTIHTMRLINIPCECTYWIQ